MDDLFEFYSLDFQATYAFPGPVSDNPYITDISCTIGYYDEDEEYEIGRLSAEYVDLERANCAGVDCYALLDEHSSELEACSKLFELSGYPSIARKTFDALGHGRPAAKAAEMEFIHIPYLEIVEEHRGKQVGRRALRHLLGYMHYTYQPNFFVLSPRPLQRNIDWVATGEKDWTSRMNYHAFRSDDMTASGKLRRYFADLGFSVVKGTSLMVAPSEAFEDRFPEDQESELSLES